MRASAQITLLLMTGALVAVGIATCTDDHVQTSDDKVVPDQRAALAQCTVEADSDVDCMPPDGGWVQQKSDSNTVAPISQAQVRTSNDAWLWYWVGRNSAGTYDYGSRYTYSSPPASRFAPPARTVVTTPSVSARSGFGSSASAHGESASS